MVAWDGSQESTRAIYDAMPFLRLAQQVSVLTIDETAKRSRPGSATGKDIAATIERHGVRAEIVALSGVDHSGVGEALLSQAADLGADLLVMGAYGHARWREMVLGGATRTVMSSATLPVLLSN
jgi:nucleotide-binding universal stress UspA family protein